MGKWIDCSEKMPTETSRDSLVVWNGRWKRVADYLVDSKGYFGFYSPHGDKLKGITHYYEIEHVGEM